MTNPTFAPAVMTSDSLMTEGTTTLKYEDFLTTLMNRASLLTLLLRLISSKLTVITNEMKLEVLKIKDLSSGQMKASQASIIVRLSTNS